MSAPSEPHVRVWYYDGVSAVRRMPLLVARGDEFLLVDDEREDGPWPFASLVAHGSLGGQPQFGLRKHKGWRVGLAEDPPAEIAALLPGVKRYGGPIDRFGLIPAVIAFALVSVAVVLGVLSSPPLIAKLIPHSTERQLGDVMVGDFGERRCTTPAGDAALKALEQRLGTGKDIDIRVINFPIVNAVTLPGGHILVFNRLIEESKSPDELAGVLGHELGHVEHRDVLEHLIRSFGLRTVLGGLDGNVAGFSEALLSAGYSRNAEARADDFAIELLQRGRISTKGAAAFFHRLDTEELKLGAAGRALGYFATHPASAEREAVYAKGDKPGATPVLDAAQWQALRTICANAPKAKLSF